VGKTNFIYSLGIIHFQSQPTAGHLPMSAVGHPEDDNFSVLGGPPLHIHWCVGVGKTNFIYSPGIILFQSQPTAGHLPISAMGHPEVDNFSGWGGPPLHIHWCDAVGKTHFFYLPSVILFL